MDFYKYQRPEVQQFLSKNVHADLIQFLLKKSPFSDITIQELAHQLKGRKEAQNKFPYLLKEGIVFPPQINLEQSSSAVTARYKAGLIQGKSFADLTSGFGTDAFFLSENFETVTLIEQNEALLDIVQHNWKILNRSARFLPVPLENFLENNSKHYDVIYLDPARRDQQHKKVFLLEDLSPDILRIQDELLKISGHLMIKLSPMIDISYLLSVLKNIFRIDIIAVKNEVKEIVVHQSLNAEKRAAAINCVNLGTENPPFIFNQGEEKSASPACSEPQKFIYIPNTAILKSGAFNLISERLNIAKLHPNTHLYTSENLVPNFPGRVLEMKKIASSSIKKGEQWNIISKNYPLSTAQIEHQYKIKQGGKRYLIFTQSLTEKIILQSL